MFELPYDHLPEDERAPRDAFESVYGRRLALTGGGEAGYGDGFAADEPEESWRLGAHPGADSEMDVFVPDGSRPLEMPEGYSGSSYYPDGDYPAAAGPGAAWGRPELEDTDFEAWPFDPADRGGQPEQRGAAGSAGADGSETSAMNAGTEEPLGLWPAHGQTKLLPAHEPGIAEPGLAETAGAGQGDEVLGDAVRDDAARGEEVLAGNDALPSGRAGAPAGYSLAPDYDPFEARERARAALVAAGELSPAAIETSERLAAMVGVPARLALHAPKEAAREAAVEALGENPPLAAWAGQSPRNAVIAAENAGWALDVHRVFAAVDGGLDLGEFSAANRAMGLEALQAGGRMLTRSPLALWNGLLGVSRAFWGSMRSMAELAGGEGSEAAQYARRQVETAEAMAAQLPEQAGAVEKFWYDVLENIPQMGAGLGIALGAAAAGAPLAVGGAASSLFMGSHIFGSSYNELRKKGINPASARFGAGINAALQLPMEWFQVTRYLRLFDNPSRSLARSMGAAAASEFVTEAMQQAPEYVGHAWAESSLHAGDLAGRWDWFAEEVSDRENLLKATRDALYSGLIGAALGAGFGGAAHLASRNHGRGVEKAVGDYLEEARRIAGQATSRRLLDAAFRNAGPGRAGGQSLEVLENSLPHSLRSLYFTPGDFQELGARHGENRLLEALDLDAGEARRMIELGMPIRVSTARVLYQDEEMGEDLRASSRLDPNGPSYREAGAWSAEQHVEDMSRIMDQADDLEDLADSEALASRARRAQAAVGARQAARREMTRIRRELVAAGMAEHEARANADLIFSHAMAFYESYGADPAAMLSAMFNFRGEAQEAGGETGAEAGVEAGRPRGQTEFRPDGQTLIRLLRGADVSTAPHEVFHVFLENLFGIAADNGQAAMKTLGAAMEQARAAVPGPEMAQAHGEASALLGEGMSSGWQGAAASAARELRKRARAARKAQKELQEQAESLADAERQAEAEAMQANAGQLPARDAGEASQAAQMSARAATQHSLARAYTRLANLASRAARHMQALEQAKADVESLCRFAEVDPATISGDAQAYRQVQEKGASAAISYLNGAKAPSIALRDVFSRMGGWLEGYAGQELPGEIAAVFDRLLASRREIRASGVLDMTAAVEAELLASDLFTAAERVQLEKALENLRADAEAIADPSDLPADAELELNPVYELIQAGHIRREDAVDLLGSGPVEAIDRAFPELFTEDGAPAILVAAESRIYENDPLLMLAGIYEAIIEEGLTPRKLAAAKARVEAAARASQKAEQAGAAQNELYGEWLDRLDGKIAEKIAGLNEKDPAAIVRKAFSATTPRSIIANIAATELANEPVGSITPARYEKMLSDALNDRAMALSGNDLFAARNAITRARIANECLAQSRKIRADADRLFATASRIARQTNAYPEAHVEALRRIFHAYCLPGLRQSPNPEYNSGHVSMRELLAEICGEEEPDGALPSLAGWIVNLADPVTGTVNADGRINWRMLTQGQMRELADFIAFLTHDGKNAMDRHRNSERSLVQRIVQSCLAGLKDLGDQKHYGRDSAREEFRKTKDSIFRSVDYLRFQFAKAEGLTNILGEGKAGPLSQLLDQIQLQENVRRGMVERFSRDTARAMADLADLVARLRKEHGKYLRNPDGTFISLPESLAAAYNIPGFTPDMVIALALNLGNSSNIARLTSGYRDLTYDAMAEIFGDTVAQQVFGPGHADQGRTGLLSSRDWQAVQTIWDSINSFWPDSVATYRKLFGTEPNRVAATPLRVRGSDGVDLTLNGGYYPVRYDPQVSGRVANWTMWDDILSRNDSALGTPAAKMGYTKDRVKKTPRLPVLLNTSVIASHVEEVTTFITLAQLVRRADRIIRDPFLKAEYIRVYGVEDYDGIRPNLRGLVRREPPSKYDDIVKMANAVRRYLVPWGLGWNFKVAAIQLTAIFPAMGDIGVRPVLRALAHMTLHGPSTLRQIRQVSPYLNSRLYNIDQDLQLAMNRLAPTPRFAIRLGKREYTWDHLVNLGMMPIVCADAVASSAVWLAGYEKYMNDHGQAISQKNLFDASNELHAGAVRHADNIVKNSNPDYDNSSRNGFLRANNAFRLVNSFSSAISLFAARGHFMHIAHKKGRISAGRLGRLYMYDYILPATAMFLFLGAAWGYFNGEDEPEDILKLYFSTFMDNAAMRIPIFGSYLSDMFMDMLGLGKAGIRNTGLRMNINTPLEMGRDLGRLLGLSPKDEAEAKSLAQLHRLAEQNQELWQKRGWALFDIASFLARVPVSKKIEAAAKGLEQLDAGYGTFLSPVMPRPGKLPAKDKKRIAYED